MKSLCAGLGVFVFLAIVGTAVAEILPAIAPSERVLTVEEVRNYWINTLERKPVPPQPSGLHSKARDAWKRNLDSRRALIRTIREGGFRTEAKLAQLRHNAHAWTRLGNEAKAEATEARLRELEEHLARLATLELQRKAALAQIETAKRLRRIEVELSALRASCEEFTASAY